MQKNQRQSCKELVQSSISGLAVRSVSRQIAKDTPNAAESLDALFDIEQVEPLRSMNRRPDPLRVCCRGLRQYACSHVVDIRAMHAHLQYGDMMMHAR